MQAPLAVALGIAAPGTFSAHGMLEAEIRHDLVHPYFARWDRMDHKQVGDATEALASSARHLLEEDGIDSSNAGRDLDRVFGLARAAPGAAASIRPAPPRPYAPA